MSVVLRNVAFCLLALAVVYVLRSQRRAVERARRPRERRRRCARSARSGCGSPARSTTSSPHTMVAINVQAGVAAHLLDPDPEQARSALRDDQGDERRGAEGPPGRRSASCAARRCGAPRARHGPRRPRGPHGRACGQPAIQVGRRRGARARARRPSHAAGYRIAQESLTNVLRHARATRARVRVAREGDPGAGGGHRRRPGKRRRTAAPATGCGGWRSGRRRCTGALESGPAAGGGWRVHCAIAGGRARRDRRRARRRPGARPRGLPRAARRSGRHRGSSARRRTARRRSPSRAAHRPDVVLMDVRMPRDRRAAGHGAAHGGSGAERHAGDRADHVRARRVRVRCAAGRGPGFMLKDVEPAELVDAVRVVAGGEALLMPRHTRRLIEAFVAQAENGPPRDDAVLEELTPREREVLTLVGQGSPTARSPRRSCSRRSRPRRTWPGSSRSWARGTAPSSW